MRCKRAKLLRRLAEQMAPIRERGYTFEVKKKRDINNLQFRDVGMVRLVQGCTRRIYQFLKKDWMRQSSLQRNPLGAKR